MINNDANMDLSSRQTEAKAINLIGIYSIYRSTATYHELDAVTTRQQVSALQYINIL